jgi:hypothetical protein
MTRPDPHPDPDPGLVDRLAKVLSAHEAMAKVDAKAYRLVFRHACGKVASNLKRQVRAGTEQLPPVTQFVAGPNPVMGRTPHHVVTSALVDRLLKHTAWDMIRSEDRAIEIAEAIKELEQWEFIRTLVGGQDILDTGRALQASITGLRKVLGGHIGELAARISKCQPAELDQYRVLVDQAENYLRDWDRVVRAATGSIKKVIDDEAWKAVYDEEASTRIALARGAANVVAGLLNVTVAVGKVAYPAPGVAAGGSAVQAGIGMANKKADQLLRDHDIAELEKKHANNPDFPFEKLNQNVFAMAERIAAKQVQNTASIMNALAIPGSEIPGWTIIRNGIESIIGAYYKARVEAAQRSFGAKTSGLEQLKEFLKEKVWEPGFEGFKEKLAELVGEQIKQLGEQEKAEFAESAAKTVGQVQEAVKAHEAVKGHEVGKALAGAGEAAGKSAAEVVGEFAKGFAITSAENVAIKVAGFVLQKVLARMPIQMAEVVTGDDLKDIKDMMTGYDNALQEVQTGLDEYA